MRRFCETAFAAFNVGILMLTSEISLMELRLRSSPQALDDIRFLTLIYTAYFAIAHGMAADGNDDKRRFRTVIRRSLAARSTDIRPTVAALAIAIQKQKSRFYFLRRCAILEYCLAGEFTGSNDWDALLRWDALCAHFGLELEGEPGELPPYTFCELPDTFLGFFTPPWSLSRDLTDPVLLSLTTGDCISTTPTPQPGEISVVDLRAKVHGTYVPVIIMGGKHANTGIYISFEWGKQVANASSPIYVDRFGDPDIGFQRGTVLKLSRDAVEREVDRLLSHAWTDAVV
jgi:hypothetical protein